MAELGELQVKIGVDTSTLQRGLGQAQGQLRTFGASTKTTGAGLTQMAGASDKAARSVKTNLLAAITTIEGPLSRTGSIVTRLAGPAGFAALGALSVVALTKAATAAAGLARDAGLLVDELGDLALTSGVTVENLQLFRNLERTAGVSLGAIGTAAERMSERLERGGETADRIRGAFDTLGISLGQGVGPAMDEVIEALADIDDQGERSQLAIQLFDRQWRDIAPVLGLGGDRIRELNERLRDFGLITPLQAQQADAFRQEVEGLNTVLETLKTRVGAELSQPLTALVEIFTSEQNINALGQAATNFGNIAAGLQAIAEAIPGAGAVANIQGLAGALAQVARTLPGFGQAEAVARGITRLGAADRGQQEALDELRRLRPGEIEIGRGFEGLFPDVPSAAEDFMGSLRRAIENEPFPNFRIGAEEAAEEAGTAAGNVFGEEFRRAFEQTAPAGFLRSIEDAIETEARRLEGLELTQIAEGPSRDTAEAIDEARSRMERLETAAEGARDVVRDMADTLRGLGGLQLENVIPRLPAHPELGAFGIAQVPIPGMEGLEEALEDGERALRDWSTAQINAQFLLDGLGGSLLTLGQAVEVAILSTESFGQVLARALPQLGAGLGRAAGNFAADRLGNSIGQTLGSFIPIFGEVAGGIIGSIVGGVLREELFEPSPSGQALIDAINQVTEEQDRITAIVDAIATLEQDIAGQQAGEEGLPFPINTLQDALKLLEEELKELTGAADETSESIRSLGRNVPEGFKTARARFESTIAGFGPRDPNRLSALGEAVVSQRDAFHVEGDVVIQNNAGDSGEDLMRKLEGAVMNRQSRGGGGLRLAPSNAAVTG